MSTLQKSELSKKQKVQVWVVVGPPGRVTHVALFRTRPERGAFWQPITGSVDPGEDLKNAACRETAEESGLRVKADDLIELGDFHYQNERGAFHETAYALRAYQSVDTQLPELSLDPTEHDQYKWCAPNDAIVLLKHASNQLMLQTLLKILSPEASKD